MASLAHTTSKGSVVITTLVFATIFVMLVSGLTGYVVVQKKATQATELKEKALQIAEAGLDYYKWRLAHDPTDMQDGTGAMGPYVHDFADPEGGIVGQFSLDISGTSTCNTLSYVDITSTGYTTEEPNLSRVVYGRYARPSVAEYAYLINSSVWVGGDREIYGPYHSNGGIRMDGINHSIVTSAQATWSCTSSFGCNPASTTQGVFGAGLNYSLWQYPVSTIDFAGITIDIANIKTLAQSSGLYFPQVSGATPRRGYRVVINPDKTLDVWEVTDSDRIWSYDNISDPSSPWNQRYEVVASETFMGTYALPESCSVVFFEDRVWIEGQVNGKMTIVSGDVTNPNFNTDVILNGNITYVNGNGVDGLTLIAQQNIRVPLISPDSMELNGIFIAQEGNFGRNHYVTTGSKDVPTAYDAYVTQSLLTVTGTIVANGRVGTKWVDGSGNTLSGYENRINSYDSNLADAPPPLTPYVSDDYGFILWREDVE